MAAGILRLACASPHSNRVWLARPIQPLASKSVEIELQTHFPGILDGAVSASQAAPRSLRCQRARLVFGSATPLTVNDALQATMLFAESEFLPNLPSPTLDKILAVGVRPDVELDNFVSPVSATMPINEAIDCRAHAAANTIPCRCSHLLRPSRNFAKSLPSASSAALV